MKIPRIPIIAVVLLAIAAFIIFHQVYLFGNIWEWEDFIHHETPVAICVFTSVLLVIYANMAKPKKK